ncbi:MAG: LysE family translocator [Rhizomicrobium sp.]
MTHLQAIAAFALAAGLLTVTPGLDTALVLRTAAVEGRGRGMQVAAGIGLGCLAWGTAASLGLGALLAISQLAYDALRIAGALYMMWLGARLVLAAWRKSEATAAADTSGTGSWLLRGFLCNILNPKAGAFYITILPLFIPPGANVVGFSLLLTLIHDAEGLLWFWLLTTLMRPMAGWIQKSSVTRALDGVTGSVLIAFGVGLFSQRR